MTLKEKYRPSEPCSCEICTSYCLRPGWWSVDEAERAISAGLAKRMMLEISPERDFGVLSPSFKGNECNFALQMFSKNGCTFLTLGLCELFGTGFQPLECRFCHHDRKGQGINCHQDLEKEWKTKRGQQLVVKWANIVGL
jgi:hypothetical protein